ncbi:MAG TPA: DUF2846 domain-containing protein [Rhodocyclaceae bacterium]|jgi:hypothetical protein|nr:DUF2846 domain-containing protein [Rhodocyclaceae bacterium]HNM20922.1 DUF2846 domain-containing protein [Rhodocyclaceae bacterium]HNM80132.1 DUF2846 domain-containing protein [Rhodocyclaceae bacterium]HNP05437.1 DUF2846 domain-containing protein [Rhodocyclaceae bacterium]
MSYVAKASNFFAAISIVALTGCASINKAPASAEAESKQFVSKPNVSQVYVYRNETLGAAISMPVTVNGQLAGNTGPHSFFRFELQPGEHVITSQGNESRLTLTTEAGGLYYVWQEVKMGAFSAGSKLQLVSDSVGKQGVSECSQIQSSF